MKVPRNLSKTWKKEAGNVLKYLIPLYMVELVVEFIAQLHPFGESMTKSDS